MEIGFIYIMSNVESVPLKKSKSLCFASKENFLRSDGLKSNDENMKSNDKFLSHGGENEGTFFWVIL